MLVLSRRPKQTVLFPGFNVIVRVVSVKGDAVRLGIDAPPEVAIRRGELKALPGRRGISAAPSAPVPEKAGLDGLLRRLLGRLEITGRGLGVVQLLLESGNVADAKEVLARVREDFQLLRWGVEGELSPTPEERPAPAPAAPGAPLKALLVEDDRNQRELLAGFLRMAGLSVDTAGDGADALDYLRSCGRPDVVLLDMGLPRCDGATIVRRLRNDPAYAGLRIFAVTASSPAEFDLDTGPAGVDRWFQKPLDPESLLDDLTWELCAV
jgi:carbon storage regulator CsrA